LSEPAAFVVVEFALVDAVSFGADGDEAHPGLVPWMAPCTPLPMAGMPRRARVSPGRRRGSGVTGGFGKVEGL
jgi:hypothetical protein